jgi:HK97 gp10 family phage protein
MTLTVRVEGLAALDRALAELKASTAKAVLRRVGKAALEPVAAEARRLAPDDPTTKAPHDLATSIVISEKSRSGRSGDFRSTDSTVTLWMGPTGGGYPQAMIQEFGAGPHTITAHDPNGHLAFEEAGQLVTPRVVHHPGNPPHPYMRPAWEAGKAQVLETIRTELGAEIAKTAARVAARQARKR